MRNLLLIITIATIAVVANAQNKVTGAKTAPEMVYYYVSIQNSPSCHFTKNPYMTGFI